MASVPRAPATGFGSARTGGGHGAAVTARAHPALPRPPRRRSDAGRRRLVRRRSGSPSPCSRRPVRWLVALLGRRLAGAGRRAPWPRLAAVHPMWTQSAGLVLSESVYLVLVTPRAPGGARRPSRAGPDDALARGRSADRPRPGSPGRRASRCSSWWRPPVVVLADAPSPAWRHPRPRHAGDARGPGGRALGRAQPRASSTASVLSTNGREDASWVELRRHLRRVPSLGRLLLRLPVRRGRVPRAGGPARGEPAWDSRSFDDALGESGRAYVQGPRRRGAEGGRRPGRRGCGGSPSPRISGRFDVEEGRSPGLQRAGQWVHLALLVLAAARGGAAGCARTGVATAIVLLGPIVLVTGRDPRHLRRHADARPAPSPPLAVLAALAAGPRPQLRVTAALRPTVSLSAQ